jgi:hypothetical protein
MIYTSSEVETLENPPRLGSQVIWVAQGSDDGADALDNSEVQHRLGREKIPRLLSSWTSRTRGGIFRFSRPNHCNVSTQVKRRELWFIPPLHILHDKIGDGLLLRS